MSERWRTFHRDDRIQQLVALAGACEDAAISLRDVGDRLAGDYAAFGDEVRDVAARAFDQRTLTVLSSRCPDTPERLHPKALDAGVPLTAGWDVAERSVRQVHELSLLLRATATAEEGDT